MAKIILFTIFTWFNTSLIICSLLGAKWVYKQTGKGWLFCSFLMTLITSNFLCTQTLIQATFSAYFDALMRSLNSATLTEWCQPSPNTKPWNKSWKLLKNVPQLDINYIFFTLKLTPRYLVITKRTTTKVNSKHTFYVPTFPFLSLTLPNLTLLYHFFTLSL